MKTICSITFLLLTGCFVASNATAQITASRITKKIKDANAAQNQSLGKSLDEPTPALAPPLPKPNPKPVQVITNVVPEKSAEQKAKMLQKTIEFQKKRAEAGASTAQYDLGMRYLNGDGVEKNPELAQKWLNSAATNGNAQAVKKLEELKKKALD